MAWTVEHYAGRELEGVEAEIAEMEDCEAYECAVIKIPEIGFGAEWDDREPQSVDRLDVARRIARLPELEAELKRANSLLKWMGGHILADPEMASSEMMAKYMAHMDEVDDWEPHPEKPMRRGAMARSVVKFIREGK